MIVQALWPNDHGARHLTNQSDGHSFEKEMAKIKIDIYKGLCRSSISRGVKRQNKTRNQDLKRKGKRKNEARNIYIM